MPRSIRARITLVAIACSAALLVATSAITIAVVRSQLLDNLDEGLTNRAAIIAALADGVPDRLPDEEDLLVQIVDRDGGVLAASRNLRGAGPIAPLEPGLRTIDRTPVPNQRFRAVSRPFTTGTAVGTLIVAVNFDDVNDPIRTLIRLLALVVPAVVAALGLLTWVLTGRTLRPVERIRTEVAEITASNLGRRVPEPTTGDEIARLAKTMNGTLDRLEDSLRRQQRFVADASHELRSPLTRIRSELEVNLAHPTTADPIGTERSVLAETIGLQELVEDLLHLARADAGSVETTMRGLDLDDIVLREARRLLERGRVRVDAIGVTGVTVTGDAGQLGRALHNLLSNAERHAATTVTVTLNQTGHTARITVADDGAGIPLEDRATVFERFTRLDDGRTRDVGGSGLGLAITRDIIERHGGTIALAPGLPTTFVVELPARS